MLRHCELLTNSVDETKTLYSFRHSYATNELLSSTDIHTLAKQMGTSVKMIEVHYGHLQPSQQADVIAGKRMTPRKTTAAKSDVTPTKLTVVK